MKINMLLRSFLFLPAYNRKFISKALKSNADAIILDMEDSVSPEKREEARSVIKEYASDKVFENKNVFIRINEIGSKDFVEDISELTLEGITGFMPSKIHSADDVVFLDKLLEFYEIKKGIEKNSFLLAPLIETTDAVANIYEIAKASYRLIALCFGGEDYLHDLGSVYTYQESAFIMPRAMIANAARSNGLLPIDTPYLNINDLKGFEEKEHLAYKNGFAGCLLVNPKQIEYANRAFLPDEDIIIQSKRVIEVINNREHDKGTESICMLDDGMIGPPMIKRAISVTKLMKMIDRID